MFRGTRLLSYGRAIVGASAADYRLSKFDDRDEVRPWDSLREGLLRRSIMFDGYHVAHLVVDEQTAQCVG